ncbi:MAG: hypothetical protein JSR26_03510 [Proteobacteria bacterium]|nr:hypothetical protein [Pseudomonadota bacterium]
MADTPLRVVILGAAGEAQQQLRNALDELGAQTLAVGDFDQLDPDGLRQQKPDVWLVSIDEGTESGHMDRWQPLFDDPSVRVVFDDADVTRRLSGWDLARWARHLAAKVLGRDDVLLPPVNPGAERVPQKGSGESESDAGDASLAALNASFEAGRSRTRDEAPAPSLDDLLSGQASAPAAPAAVAAPAPVAAIAGAVAAPAAAKTEFSLVDEDADLSVPASAPKAAVPAPNFDLSGLSLEPLATPEPEKKVAVEPMHAQSALPARGVIAIMSGLGGPDAVRQFLGKLPNDLQVPVVLWQILEAGKHDRLAQQMAKSTTLPVYLAQPGETVRPGEVAVMAARMGIQASGDWVVREGSPSASHALAPALKHPRSVLVVLSGSEPMIVEFARNHQAGGGTVLVQSSSSCFDGAAASALERQGMASGSPAGLAEQAVQAVNAK